MDYSERITPISCHKQKAPTPRLFSLNLQGVLTRKVVGMVGDQGRPHCMMEFGGEG